jgi:flagellar biosynthesis protein FlhF
MAEAMARLRAEMGAEAVILSTRRTTEGVEVTAALEAEEEPLFLPPVAPPPELARHRLPEALAAELASHPLPEALAGTLRFAPLPEERPLLLVGPAGAGKTLTCAKLAARLVMRGAAPLVVTADGERAGAVEQLAAFTRLLGVTLAAASSAGALTKALAHRAEGQRVLIDTPGCDPFDPAAARALGSLAAAAQGETVLVLPAGIDACEAAELARAFALLGARHMIPTRLDVARRLGGVLAAASAGGLALTEAGTGPGVADGLTPLTPKWLARRLLQPAGPEAA